MIGAILAVVWAIAWSLSHNPWLASAFCVAASVFLTGALHEDGLADSADLLGVLRRGRRRRSKPYWMIRIMAPMVLPALVLSLVLRVVLLATFASGIVSAFVLLLILKLCRERRRVWRCVMARRRKKQDKTKPKTRLQSLAAGWRPKNEEAAPEFVLLLAVVFGVLVSFVGRWWFAGCGECSGFCGFAWSERFGMGCGDCIVLGFLGKRQDKLRDKPQKKQARETKPPP